MRASFRDDAQRALVCITLLNSLGMGLLWSEHGPTEAAIEIWEKHKFGPWSHGEQIIWGLAWALWAGDDNPAVPFGEIIYTLDATRLSLVGNLVAALGNESSIDDWIAAWTR